MVRNQEKYDQAVSLRKRGFTLEEIAKYCDIAKSTASKWLQNKAFSTEVTKQNKRRAGADNAKRLRLVNKARAGERAWRYTEAAQAAAVSFKHYKKDPLFIAGIMVYVCAGDHKNRSVIRLASKEMDIHKVFIRFVQEYLGVEKNRIHLSLLLYGGAKEAACLQKWQRATKLPLAQFYKPQHIKNQTTVDTLHSGVGNTIICSTVLKHTLQEWVSLASKELAK